MKNFGCKMIHFKSVFLPALHLGLFLAASLISPANGNVYYIDSKDGNDNNQGQSIAKAWKTISKVNDMVFQPGDQIYLKRGSKFVGFLKLQGSGTAEAPIHLAAYGRGKRPVIDASGFDFAIRLFDGEFWEIADMETTGGNKAGIYIGCTKDDLVLDHFRINNCYVHDIGDTSKLDWELSTTTGGIIVVNGTIEKDGKPVFYNSLFNDVIIDNCTVRYNYRWTCISITSGKKDGKRGNSNYIKNCTAEYSSADGIRMNGVQNSFIEYCVMYRNGAWPNYPGRNLGGLGAWFWDAANCTIQYCEASHVQAASTDGGAFDIDYLQTNSTVQYCYGHDCSGYGVSVFGADSAFPTVNSVVRYNVFSNNGRDPAFAFQGEFFVFTWAGGSLNGVKIYNNTSYWNPAIDTPAVRIDADFSGSNPNIFTNNIVYSQKNKLAYLKNDTMQCDNNIYWMAGNGMPEWKRKDKKYHSLAEWQQHTGHEKNSKYADPLLSSPTYHERGIPTSQFNLKPGSAAINAGVAIEAMGDRDFFGNAIPEKSGKYDIGAHEYGSKKNKKESNKKLGSALHLPTIHGKSAAIKEFLGSTILLSFIDVCNPQAILSQLTVVRSMKKQYAENGLHVILVDGSSNEDENKRNEMIANFIEDHELKDIILWDNKKENVAGSYGVKTFPTTFLISKDGNIRHKWENTALSADLAMAIENDLGDVIAVKHF